MPKRKQPELTPAEQKKRFEALAREVGARQSVDDFKRTLGKIASPQGKASKGKPKTTTRQNQS